MGSRKKINVVILGSTGSIGVNTLKVIENLPERFNVLGVSAYNNSKLLSEQVARFRPQYAAVTPKVAKVLKSQNAGCKILDVHTDLEYLVSLKSVDVVVIAMRGSAALKPFLAAVRAGKKVAPANKEALVIAGEILMKEARRHKSVVIPIDSEQSAIFQCLAGNPRKYVKHVYLTASGGSLRKVPKTRFGTLTKKEILDHPRWKMGEKITVDSATLMNKGFEVIEAKRLFNLKPDQIKVVIHPQAIIHSMVEFCDHSVLAQLGIPDMRLPIQYALTFPERLEAPSEALDFFQFKRLDFEEPDFKKFPALELCFDVLHNDGTLPSVLNAADEEAVESFLEGKTRFVDIYPVVERVVRAHKNIKNPSLEDIFDADQWAREEARRLIKEKT